MDTLLVVVLNEEKTQKIMGMLKSSSEEIDPNFGIIKGKNDTFPGLNFFIFRPKNIGIGLKCMSLGASSVTKI